MIEIVGFAAGVALWLGFLACIGIAWGRAERARVRERRRGGADLRAAQRPR